MPQATHERLPSYLDRIQIPYALGIAIALGCCAFARQTRLDRDGAFYPTLLAVMATYYILFAAISGSLRTAALESGVAPSFCLAFDGAAAFVLVVLTIQRGQHTFDTHGVTNVQHS